MSVELEEQLANTQSELDTLRAEFSEFAHIVSHELAAPFRHIEGFSNIILSDHGELFDDRTRRHFANIVNGATKGSQILQALLAYSNLSTQKLRVSTVDCNAILDDVFIQLSSLIEDNKAQYSCTKLPVIKGDNMLIHQLFLQLVHNAMHYHKPGNHPLVSIAATEKESCWEFCIKDNGIGISDKQLEQVFIVLKRSVSEKNYSGSGMGLAIAKQIVQRHGGKIWLQSNERNGCSCYFTLPKSMHGD